MKKNKISLLQLLGLMTVFLGLVGGLILVQRSQEIREKAAVPGGIASMKISPESGSYNVNDTIPAGIYFNTGNTPIGGVAVRITIPFSGLLPDVDVTSININPVLDLSGEWTCPTRDWTVVEDEVWVNIACANISANGFTSSGDTLLATVNLNVLQVPSDGKISIYFDPSESIITSRVTNQDILSIPASFAEYVVAPSFVGPVLFFRPSEFSAEVNSLNNVYDLYLDTRGYEVNGAVFELKFDTNVILITDVLEGDVMRLVNDKYVEGGTAYLSVVIADDTKPFVGVGKVASVVFDTYSTPITTYFTFEKNTQIHAKGITSNVLDKAIDGIIHISLPITPTPFVTQIPTPTDTLIPTPTSTLFPTIVPSLTPTSVPTTIPTLTPTNTPFITPTVVLSPTPVLPTDTPTVPTSTVTPQPTVCILLGDANGDCRIDGIDYIIWLLHFGQTTQNGPADGDFNSDGVVDGVDYAIWYIYYR